MNGGFIEEYYSNDFVRGEITAYCKGRWVAVEGGALNSRVFLRYWRNGNPLYISSSQDISDLLRYFRGVKPRSIYGSVNVYRKLSDKSGLDDPSNIAYASPIWDIDGELSEWRGVIDVARIIVDELERLGIKTSVFIKWSGEGAHIHVHERCFSEDVLSRYNPLDIAYSLVGFILERCREKILDMTSRFSSIKVENEIDLKRVFTAPLSLHRRRNLCCVCFKPGEIDSFEVEWADPKSFKHNVAWRRYVEGEGDEAAFEAVKAIGGYKGWIGAAASPTIRMVIHAPKATSIESKSETGGGKIGRFQVMGLLQAARYYLLTGDLNRAKSFGLNRAIFYAWAKKYGCGVSSKRILNAGKSGGKELPKEEIFQLGDEVALISRNGWFIIGGQEQRPEDYDNQIAKRIEKVISYERAWQAALEYLQGFGKETLLSQQKFFKQVYEPIRDKFLEDLLARSGDNKPKNLDRWLG